MMKKLFCRTLMLLLLLDCGDPAYAARRQGGERRSSSGSSRQARSSGQRSVSRASSSGSRGSRAHSVGRSRSYSTRRVASAPPRRAMGRSRSSARRASTSGVSRGSARPRSVANRSTRLSKTSKTSSRSRSSLGRSSHISRGRGMRSGGFSRRSHFHGSRRYAGRAWYHPSRYSRAIGGFALGFGFGAGLVFGASMGYFGNPYGDFWGPNYLFGDFGCSYYPWWGVWYSQAYNGWFYPWSNSWYFQRLGYWDYPTMRLGICLAPEQPRTVFLDNGSDDELYYAVYRRYPVDNSYYLYRVANPAIIERRRALRVQLSQERDREYVVLAKPKSQELPDRMYQDESGDVKGIGQNAPEVVIDDADRFETGALSRAELQKLSEKREEINRQREELSKISSKIEGIKDPAAEVEAMESPAVES